MTSTLAVNRKPFNNTLNPRVYEQLEFMYGEVFLILQLQPFNL